MTTSAPIKPGAVITSRFGRRWIFGGWGFHAGLDLATPSTKAPSTIHACAAGTVVGAGTGVLENHSGNIVIIDHNGYFSISCHLHRIDVKRGQKVQAGQVIGIEGATGNVTGRHHHDGKYIGGRYDGWELTGGRFEDPLPWYRARSVEPGKTAPRTVTVTTASKPASKPATSSALPSNKTIQTRLSRMGLYRGAIDGINGRLQRSAVTRYQHLNGLVQDGYWGPKTESAYRHRVRIQQALNRCKGYKIAVDGHMPDGGLTRRRIADVKRRNGLGPVTTGFSPAFKQFLIKIGAWK